MAAARLDGAAAAESAAAVPPYADGREQPPGRLLCVARMRSLPVIRAQAPGAVSGGAPAMVTIAGLDSSRRRRRPGADVRAARGAGRHSTVGARRAGRADEVSAGESAVGPGHGRLRRAGFRRLDPPDAERWPALRAGASGQTGTVSTALTIRSLCAAERGDGSQRFSGSQTS